MSVNTPPIHSLTPPAVFGSHQDSSPFLFPRSNDDLVKNALIMIVDDEEATTEIIRRYLKLAGFSRFSLITDSAQAVEAIVEEQPDLVLLDLMMPVNGVSILKEVRGRQETFRIPILTLTSNEEDVTRTTLLNLGANDFLQKPVHANELVARVRNALASKIAFDQLAIRSAQLQADVLQDALTGLANRRAFDFELHRKMIEWERQRTPVSLLLVDIDHFKMVNDRFGHQAGDTVLKEVANLVRDTTRKMDLPCRIGGEEFAVILPVTRVCESNLAAERIREKIEAAFIRTETATIRLTVSLGVANAMKGDDAQLLFRRADTALYASKQRGRNCATLHDGTKYVALDGTPTTVDVPEGPASEDSVEFNINASRVTIIDDEPSTVAIVQAYLNRGGFERISTITDSSIAFNHIVEFCPDLVLLDIHMPGADGLMILKEMRDNERTRGIPVLFLTSSTETGVKVEALNLGANDFLHKPINEAELLARVRNTLMAKAHVDLLAGYSARLEHEVQLRTQQLVASRREAIQCLARAAEMRDDKTGQHVLRVGRYAAIIARELGFSGEQIVDLEHAAQLHDVGKIGVPDAILNKPDALTNEEFETIKEHCCAGSRIIRDDSGRASDNQGQIGGFLEECSSPVMRLAALVAETHHEKWDGTGYPRGLQGEEIPIEGRITAICDVFDAISTSRPYKKAFPLDTCFKMIMEGSGTHFDPAVVAAFFSCQDEIIVAFNEYSD